MEAPLQMDPNDIISTLTEQRNACMDEIVRQSAIIRALQRELNKSPEEPKAEKTD